MRKRTRINRIKSITLAAVMCFSNVVFFNDSVSFAFCLLGISTCEIMFVVVLGSSVVV